MSEPTVTKNNKIKSGTNAIVMVAAILVLLGVVNKVGYSQYSRFDMTEGDTNSLSDVSEKAVETMEDLEIRFYLSKKLPRSLQGPVGAIDNVALHIQKVRDKLDEYKRASKGNLTVTEVRDDLEDHAAALNLMGMKVPGDKTDEADPEAPNKRYYIAISLHYRTVEEVLPSVVDVGRLEYAITKSLLRLKSKQAASVVMRDLLQSGKALNEQVETCVNTIKNYQKAEEKDKELEGGIAEQIQEVQGDRASQVDAFLTNLAAIDAQCNKVSEMLAKQRASSQANSEGTDARQVSQEHLNTLQNKIGWFDGLYQSWVASLINEKRDPKLLARLLENLKHSEVSARTAALRVLGMWTRAGEDGRPKIAGPPFQKAISALRSGMKDKDPIVRSVAIQVIAQTAGASAKQELVAAFSDTDPTVREVALDLAVRLKIELEGSQLEPFLKSPAWQVRRMALAYFIENNKGLTQLRSALADQNKEVRFLAAYGLALQKDTESKGKIQAVINDLPPGQAQAVLRKTLADMDAGSAEGAETEAAPAPNAAPKAAPKAAPNPGTPAPGPGHARTPGAPRTRAAPQGGAGLRQALGRAGVDRLGGQGLPDPIATVNTLDSLKGEITTAYNALKDSPGRKNIGIYCGHEELCPFSEKESKIPEQLAQAFANQPFTKKAVDDIKNLESRLNQHNDAIRQFFLSKGYRMTQVNAGKAVPDDIDALIIYGPRKPFSEIDLYDVDQFVLSGKPVVFFLNNFEVMVNQWDDNPPYGLVSGIQSTDTNLDAFLKHYGVQNNKDLVMEPDKNLQSKINTVDMTMTNIGQLAMNAKYSYPLFPVFQSFSKSDPMVSGLRSVVLPFVSSLSVADGAAEGVSVEPLISSSENATAKSKDFILDPKRLKDAIKDEASNGPHHVAMHVTGSTVSSFFAGRNRPERAKPPAETPEGAPPAKEERERNQVDSGKVNIVVIGSNLGFENLNGSRLLHDFNIGKVAQEKVSGLGAAIPYYIRYVNAWGRFIGMQNPIHLGDRGRMAGQLPGQQTDFWQKNLDFAFGVFDWATGDAGLSAIRAKADMDRPLSATSAGTFQLVKWGLILALPLFFVVLGFVWTQWFRRMRRRRWAVSE